MAKSVSAESVELTATDVPTFFAAIDKACARVGCDRTDALYRGHSSTCWMLLPSLLRPAHRGKRLREVESDLFFEFQAQARALHDAPQSDWDTLFAMQHHGVPTRLLDWSEMLGVAIYFALRGASSTTTPCVWVLNPYRLNEETDGSGADYYAPRNLGWDEETFTYYDYGELLVECEPIDWELPIAVYPAQRNARMIAQRGFFTIHGSRPDPIEKLVPRAVNRVSLLPSAVDPLWRFVDDAGLNEATVWADIDGLARHLKERHGFVPVPGRATPPPRSARPRRSVAPKRRARR